MEFEKIYMVRKVLTNEAYYAAFEKCKRHRRHAVKTQWENASLGTGHPRNLFVQPFVIITVSIVNVRDLKYVWINAK